MSQVSGITEFITNPIIMVIRRIIETYVAFIQTNFVGIADLILIATGIILAVFLLKAIIKIGANTAKAVFIIGLLIYLTLRLGGI